MAGSSDRWTALRSRRSASPSARLPVLAALSLLFSLAASCGVDPDRQSPPPGQVGQGGAASTGAGIFERCQPGETRGCHVTLGQHGSVLSCYVGTQPCVDGRWGRCGDGSVSQFKVPPSDGTEAEGSSAAPPSGAGEKPLAFSDAGPCTNNPCDPTCQQFDEIPLGGAAISLTTWSNGSLVDLQNDPAGLIKKGLKLPCSSAADCQFNERCTAPVSGSCGHPKCAPGPALDAGCDPCVKEVCAADPTCCSTSWSQACADSVHDVCGAFCDGSLPVQGQCKPWIPGETDQKCSGIDLTLGIPCTSKATASNLLAVCNVGTELAPKGINVFAYPGGAGFTGGADACNPTGAIKVNCGPTAEPIAPGACINVTCNGVSGAEEIVVNPPGAAQVPECQCRNNWTIFSSGLSCEALSCSAAQPGSESLVPNMYLAVDRSSALKAIDWAAIQSGLSGFFQNNVENNGVGVALGFFPSKNASPPDCSTSVCDASACRSRVNFGALTSSVGDAQESTLIAAINGQSPDTTALAPTGAALQSALRQARDFLPAHPKNTAIAVLIMASEPSTCNAPGPPPASLSTPGALAGLASAAFVGDGIKTYVIGVGPVISAATIKAIAAAGGGQAFSVASGATMATELKTALVNIRKSIFPCDFPLPPAGLFDPNNTSVGYLPGGSMAPIAPLPKLSSAAACGASDGYYLDNNASPTKILLCGKTCSGVNTWDPSWSILRLPFIKVKLQCQASLNTQVYASSCPAGTKVQWGFLGWDTTTPTGTSVVFKARTADTAAGLAAAPYHALGTAHKAPADTHLCPIGAPCAIDLFSKLGGLPDASRDLLELSLTLNQDLAAGLTPAVHDWKLTYSCPPAE